GAVGDSLYVIASGEVVVSLTVEGQGQGQGQGREVARLAAGGFVGEMSLLTGEPRQASCRAPGDLACWVIGHEGLKRVLRDKPRIAEDMSHVIAGRQQALAGERASLLVDQQVERAPEQRLLARIRDFFHLN